MSDKASVSKGPFGWEWYAPCWCTLVGQGGHEATHTRAIQKAIWHVTGRCSKEGARRG